MYDYNVYYTSDRERGNVPLNREIYTLFNKGLRQTKSVAQRLLMVDITEDGESYEKYHERMLPLVIHNKGEQEEWEGDDAVNIIAKLFNIKRNNSTGRPALPTIEDDDLPPLDVPPSDPHPQQAPDNTGTPPDAGSPTASSASATRTPVATVPAQYVLFYTGPRDNLILPANGLIVAQSYTVLRAAMSPSATNNYLLNPRALPILATLGEERPTVLYGIAAEWQCRILAAINGGGTHPEPEPTPEKPEFVLYVTEEEVKTVLVPSSGCVYVSLLPEHRKGLPNYLITPRATPVLVTNEERPTVWYGTAARSYCKLLSALCGGAIPPL